MNYIHQEKWINHDGPNALIPYGEGENCDRESAFALNKAGANVDVIHINELTKKPELLNNYQILLIAGGFSYGDDLGSGQVFAQQLLKLGKSLSDFVNEEKAVIGVCNGNQILTVTGLVPALQEPVGVQEVFMSNNDNNRYTCLWNHLKVENKTPFLNGIENFILPCAHGEGKYYMTPETLDALKKNNQIVIKYVKPDGTPANEIFPYSPNGSMNDITAITNKKGNVMGIMPHPERFIDIVQHPSYAYIKEVYKRKGLKLPSEGPGLKIFKNIVEYAREY